MLFGNNVLSYNQYSQPEFKAAFRQIWTEVCDHDGQGWTIITPIIAEVKRCKGGN